MKTAQRKGVEKSTLFFLLTKIQAGINWLYEESEEIFKLLGMSYVEPELREDTGEIELAKKFKLPELIEQKDLKGDLHVHSKYSDGSNRIEEMADACRKGINKY